MKYKKPKHCNGCGLFHSAGRLHPKPDVAKYNAWCCAKGSPAIHAVGWCKTHNTKKLKGHSEDTFI